MHAAIARQAKYMASQSRSACIITGGETTVTIRGREGRPKPGVRFAAAIDIAGLDESSS
jgi:glycerate-2-kinase